jgi:hypothetical protein
MILDPGRIVRALRVLVIVLSRIITLSGFRID